MSEFTYIFRGRKTSGSPEEMQQHFEKWVAWFKDLNAKGYIKDPGHPLEAAGKVVSGKRKVVNDGPYAEAKDVVGGYDKALGRKATVADVIHSKAAALLRLFSNIPTPKKDTSLGGIWIGLNKYHQTVSVREYQFSVGLLFRV